MSTRAPMTRWLRSVVASVTGGDVIVWPAVLAAVLVGIASYLVGPDRGDIRVDVAMASMAAFLFGVLLAFTIVRTRERLALVQNLVAKGNSSLFSIHQMLAVFGDEDRRRVRDLVDRHLTDQIDYRLVDYHLATPSFLALTQAVYALDPDGPQEEAVYKELVALCVDMSADRSLIEATTGQALSAIEWSGLLLLLLLLAFSGAALFTGSVIHPHNLAVLRPVHAVRRWTWLTVLRVAYYALVVLAAGLASSTSLAVVAVLSGLSAPSFQPVQLAVLYGYRSELVVVAVRWGWLLAPLGLLLAELIR